MVNKALNLFLSLLLIFLFIFFSVLVYAKGEGSLIEVTPAISDYAFRVVKPILDSYDKKDKLSQFLKISEIITDPTLGIQTNAVKPSVFIIYDKLETIKLGFLSTFSFSSTQKQIIKTWHLKFMRENPADVFFAPSADDIIKTKAAFGCSHYARSFISIVKALGLVKKPTDLRYAISSKADNYNEALEKGDNELTINGHQFVIAMINSKWIAINTSKSEWTPMPTGFSPDSIVPPKNINIHFTSYPEVTFLLRKIGKDFNDDCSDNSLKALMNIYRSGDINDPNFMWEKHTNISS